MNIYRIFVFVALLISPLVNAQSALEDVVELSTPPPSGEVYGRDDEAVAKSIHEALALSGDDGGSEAGLLYEELSKAGAKLARDQDETNAIDNSPLWALAPGRGYKDGVSYIHAHHYCHHHGGQMATKAQLINAREKRGFSLCAVGWLADGEAGYVMNGQHAGCGQDGYNSGGRPDRNTKRAAYCVGEQLPPGASDKFIHTRKYVYLSNQFLGSGKVMTLSASNNFVMADKDPSNDRQLWEIVKQPDGRYRIYNKAISMNAPLVVLARNGELSMNHKSQKSLWTFTDAGSGRYRISNNHFGTSRVLDTYNAPGNKLFFEQSSKNTSGTFWTKTAAGS